MSASIMPAKGPGPMPANSITCTPSRGPIEQDHGSREDRGARRGSGGAGRARGVGEDQLRPGPLRTHRGDLVGLLPRTRRRRRERPERDRRGLRDPAPGGPPPAAPAPADGGRRHQRQAGKPPRPPGAGQRAPRRGCASSGTARARTGPSARPSSTGSAEPCCAPCPTWGRRASPPSTGSTPRPPWTPSRSRRARRGEACLALSEGSVKREGPRPYAWSTATISITWPIPSKSVGLRV